MLTLHLSWVVHTIRGEMVIQTHSVSVFPSLLFTVSEGGA
jgi:hypothetical protein